jgi:hypothetical protein
MTTTTLTTKQEETLTQVLALRRVTYETNTQTRRSQGRLLQTLSDDDLTAISCALADHQKQFGW